MESNLKAPDLGEDKIQKNEQIKSLKMASVVTNEKNVQVSVKSLTRKERIKFLSLEEEKFQYSLVAAEGGSQAYFISKETFMSIVGKYMDTELLLECFNSTQQTIKERKK